MASRVVISVAVIMLCASPNLSQRYVPVFNTTDFDDALSAALPGDRIHLLNTEPLVANVTFVGIANGTSEEPITIEGQGLDHAYLGSTCFLSAALTIIGNNWIVKNFTISVSYDGPHMTGSNNLVEYVTFQNISDYGVWMRGNNSGNTVRKCVFQNVTLGGIAITDSAIGINIASNEFLAVQRASVAINVAGTGDNCCGYIVGNRCYTRGNGTWMYYVWHDVGYYYRYHSNYGASVRYTGFIIYNSQFNEFRWNH